MRCGDLERYLEAFLDGRLGRSRGAVLRRHLALCATCQARVERLRQFERDTQRRFPSPEQPGSVWEGLELDLVGSNGVVGGRRLLAGPPALLSLPGDEIVRTRLMARRPAGPPLETLRPTGGRMASRLAGALLVALALGAAYQLVGGEFQPDGATVEQAYLAYRRDHTGPALSSDDAAEVAEWLSAELGRAVPLPPIPEGYHLVGADHADLGDGAAGVLIYAQLADAVAAPVMLFIRTTRGATAEPSAPQDPADVAGLQQVQWSADSLSYTAVGPLPAGRLRLFQH